MFSVEESAIVFVAILVVASMLFTLPPILSSAIVICSTIGTLTASYFVKNFYWFQLDSINCGGVLILSILLGWQVNKIRAEELFARFQMEELN